MAFHLLIVLLTPCLLCLVAVAATAAWPARAVLWALLAPAWVLAALSVGLVVHRGELAGPVLTWCRIDPPGLVLSALVLPLGAVLARGRRGDPVWRRAAPQASLAPLGLLPLPCLLATTALLGPWSWRHRLAPVWLVVAGLGALVAWPWPGLADVATAFVLAALAALLHADTPRSRAWRGVAAAL